MESLKNKIDTIILSFTGFILVLMVFLIAWQIFARYILQQPFAAGEESIRLLLIWLAICGGAYGFGSKSHIALDVIFSKVVGKNRIILDIFIYFLIFLFVLFVLVIGGTTMVLSTTTQVTPALQMPVSFLYLSLPLGGIISLYYSAYYIIRNLKHIKQGV